MTSATILRYTATYCIPNVLVSCYIAHWLQKKTYHDPQVTREYSVVAFCHSSAIAVHFHRSPINGANGTRFHRPWSPLGIVGYRCPYYL